jgi:beta-galactosidase
MLKSHKMATLALLFAVTAGCQTSEHANSKSQAAMKADGPRIETPFDTNWRFLKSDCNGGQNPAFNDAAWRTLDLPHDWSIEGPFDQHNPSGGAGAFLPDGIGWYRKHFSLPANASTKHVFVTFDGVMANSDVYINGFHLGHRPYGYVTFRYELTAHLHPGDNLLAVRADDSQEPASRWYSGAGIYRHVHLLLTNPIHFDENGTFVTTPPSKPTVKIPHAEVNIQNTVVNQSDAPATISVRVTLIDPTGAKVPLMGPAGADVTMYTSDPVLIASGATASVDQSMWVFSPKLWDLDHPNIYRAVCEILSNGKPVDTSTTPFGIRTAVFTADQGFLLNDVPIKLKGVCLHGDMGALGVAVPLAAWQHRLAALKALGVNAIRTAHNPPAPEFLDLCDRMGFLVMDEMFDCWLVAKNKFDYHLYFKDWNLTDTRDTVRRDRNHPSVILYSAGNEIHDTPNAANAIPILTALVKTFH